MIFKTEADRASAQATKARHDAGEAGSSAASSARNLGAAVLATLAEATAPEDDRKGRKHASKARARALKAARKDKETAARAAAKAASHGRKAAEHTRAAADKRAEVAGGTLAALAGTASQSVADAATVAAGSAKEAGSSLAAKVSSAELTEKARASAHSVGRAAAREKAEETRTRALLGVDHGLDAALPRASEGLAAVGPRVDHVRDVINNELLPKLQEMITEVQHGKDRLLTEQHGAVAALTGTPKKRRRKGRVLLTLGVLAAAGAGIAWYLDQQQRQGASDPWASQAGGADPWASRTPTSSADPLAEPAPALGATGHATEVTSDVPAATTTVDATPAAGTTTFEEPHLLDSEEIDALASDTPTTAEEETPGESPTEEIAAAKDATDGDTPRA